MATAGRPRLGRVRGIDYRALRVRPSPRRVAAWRESVRQYDEQAGMHGAASGPRVHASRWVGIAAVFTMIFAVICVLTGLAMLATDGDLFGVFFAAAVVTFGAAAAWVYFQWRVRHLAEGWRDPYRLMAFAKDNGFHAVPVAGPADLPGRIFGRGLEGNRVRHDVVAWVQSGRQCQVATESWHSGAPSHGGAPTDEGSCRYLAVRISDQPLPLTMFDALGYPSIDGPPEEDGVGADAEHDEGTEAESVSDEAEPVSDQAEPMSDEAQSVRDGEPSVADDASGDPGVDEIEPHGGTDADPQAEVDDSDADDDPQPSEEDSETTGRPWQLMATPGAEDWAESIFSERTVRLLTDPTFPRDAEIVGEWFIAYDLGAPEPLSISHWERTFALVASLPEYPVAPPAVPPEGDSELTPDGHGA